MRAPASPPRPALLAAAALALISLSPLPEPFSGLPAARADGEIKLDGLKVTTYPGSGPPSMRVDLVILGDGYVREDLVPGGRWSTDAARLVKLFFDKIPFKDLRALFNVHIVDVASLDRGADDAPGKDTRRTAFNSTYGARGIARLLVAQDQKAVTRAAANAPGADIILIMVNDPRFGGSGGATSEGIPDPVCSVDAVAYLVAIHELGHSLANLGDEYVDEATAPSYPMPKAGDIDAPNLTLASLADTTSRESLIKTIKWGRYLRSPARAEERGFFEGGYYRAKGVYRPSASCTMADQSGGGRWCFVCLDEMTRALYRLCKRGVSGALAPAPFEDPPRTGVLGAIYDLYEAGRFSKVLAEVAKIEKREKAPAADKEGAARLAKAVDESFEKAVAVLEGLTAASDGPAAKEYAGLMEAAFKGTPREKEVQEKKKALK